MEVNCEGCAGCCLDWRALSPLDDAEHGGRRRSIDDAANLAPLLREEVRSFVDADLGGALTPRLWSVESMADAPATATVDGRRLAAIPDDDGGPPRPVFFVGLRTVPKPVAPFDGEPTWLPACAFLDPATLQCRLHDDELYPATCADYPGANLRLEAETECERVERVHGGDRLLDDEPPARLRGLWLGPQALGAKLFAHPDPDDLAGRIDRLAAGEPTPEDRATFVGVAAGSAPGTASVDAATAERYREAVLEGASWVDDALADWRERAGAVGEDAPDPALARAVEDDRDAPPTPGWE